jgi:hypothetical protein
MSKHICLIFLILVLAACQPSSGQPTATVDMAPSQNKTAEATLTPAIMADFFFSACAFLDANGNSVWDEADTPVEGAQMGLSIDGGQTFALGDLTGSDGCASVWAPGGGIEAPFTIRMDPPVDSGLISIGESEVLYEAGPSPRFLFQEP